MEDLQNITQDNLKNLPVEFDNFVGVDSDGCVFDTMEIKQKQCFHPVIVSHWKLERIEKYVRETAEFVNLYSAWRGQNRFPSLLRTMDLLNARPEVVSSGVDVPKLDALREFIDSGKPLGNPSLEAEVAQTGNDELRSVLEWSCDVNDLITRTVRKVPPFPWAKKSLEKIPLTSVVICVSQTPTEALVREWRENDLMQYVKLIAGQELGSKTEHIRLAAGGRYAPDRILMIGDAPGDGKAADDNNALFYPINPGHEDESWERFYKEGYTLFLDGKFRGAYQDKLRAEFNSLLPEKPSFKSKQAQGA